MPGCFSAVVRGNQHLGADLFLLDLHADARVEEARPGQFLMLRGNWGRDPIGSRALSVLDQPEPRCLRVLLRAVGRGTRLLANARAGERLACVGPLGTAFPPPPPDRRLILIAGGVGLPPVYFVASYAGRAGNPPRAELLYGGRSTADLVLRDELAALRLDVHCTTDDGSFGARGVVTDLLAARLGTAHDAFMVYACGPTPMLRAVRRLALAHQVPAYLSLEESMACGFGACLGCAVPTGDGTTFRYCCTDGPVFDARELAWDP